MGEDKHTEWKESWRDEYLKWVCGFANAQGGVLEIGKNDKGRIIGISNASRLLKDLPNKIRDILGIIPEIDHVKEQGKSLILIKIKPCKHPVNYNGKFYYRSGSTNQELRGPALHHFLLDKSGQTWDSVIVPKIKMSALDSTIISNFCKMAVESKRLSADIIKKSHDELFKKKLNLKGDEEFKRASVLLFHPDPERYISGAYIKIGYFKTDSKILFHDDIHGDLFTQVKETMNLLLTKYLKALISYEGLYRVETYPMPKSALREAVLNAIIHKDYSTGSPIQIRVYDNKVELKNTCRLPEGWTVKSIARKNQSRPHNPNIAQVFFWANMVERWGHGIQKMRDECKAFGVPGPKIRGSNTDICLEFKNHEASIRKKLEEQTRKSEPMMIKETPEKMTVEMTKKMLEILRLYSKATIPELAQKMAKSESTIWRIIKKLQKEGYLKRIGSNKTGYWKIIKKLEK